MVEAIARVMRPAREGTGLLCRSGRGVEGRINCGEVVDVGGVEPPTSALRTQRSPN